MESEAPAKPPRGYKQATVHIIFDVKLDAGFTCKAILMTNGHKVDTPPSTTYASVMSRDSGRIVLTVDYFNGLDVQCNNSQNVYLNAKPREKVFLYAVEEFDKEEGKLVIVIHVLYGMKGAESIWATAIHQLMRDLGF